MILVIDARTASECFQDRARETRVVSEVDHECGGALGPHVASMRRAGRIAEG